MDFRIELVAVPVSDVDRAKGCRTSQLSIPSERTVAPRRGRPTERAAERPDDRPCDRQAGVGAGGRRWRTSRTRRSITR